MSKQLSTQLIQYASIYQHSSTKNINICLYLIIQNYCHKLLLPSCIIFLSNIGKVYCSTHEGGGYLLMAGSYSLSYHSSLPWFQKGWVPSLSSTFPITNPTGLRKDVLILTLTNAFSVPNRADTDYCWFSFESVVGSSWVAMEVQDLASHSQIANPKSTPIVLEILGQIRSELSCQVGWAVI